MSKIVLSVSCRQSPSCQGRGVGGLGLQVEVTQGEDVVRIHLLAARLVDEVGLPCAYMNLGLVGVAEVPHHEDVALIAVVARVPLLMDGDTIDALDGGVRHDGDVIEVHFDIA